MTDDDRKIPGESVQIAAQLFALTLADDLSARAGVPPDMARKRAAVATRECMDANGLTPTRARNAQVGDAQEG